MKLERRVCPHCRGKGETFGPAPGELRRHRESLGLSLREVARRLGYSPPYISDVELGRRGVTASVLSGYAALLR